VRFAFVSPRPGTKVIRAANLWFRKVDFPCDIDEMSNKTHCFSEAFLLHFRAS
jgi:hypothetical protein